MDYFLIWVLPSILVGGIGFWLWLSTKIHIRHCKKIASWLKTDGVIESSQVRKLSRRRYEQSIRVNYQTIRYEPQIIYLFNVNGRQIQASGYQNFNGELFKATKSRAEEIIARYPPGAKVEVTYNPDNPSEAYLQPATNTDRLVRQNRGNIIVLIFALFWLITGSTIQISGQLAQKSKEQEVKSGEALLPVNMDLTEAKLQDMASKYGLVCSEESTAGQLLVYQVMTCKKGDVSNLTSVDIYSRQNEPQKVDLMSAIQTPAGADATVQFFSESTSLVLNEQQQIPASEWIKSALPEVISTGQSASTTLDNITLTLDNLGTNVRLNIGKLQ